MRTLALTWLLLAISCRHVSADASRVTLKAADVVLDMPADGIGHLSFHVESPLGPPVSQVEWSLLLDGTQVASGLDGAPRTSGTDVYVDVPVVIHHLQWKDGAAWVQVTLRGGLLLGSSDGAERVPFTMSEERLTSGHFDPNPLTH